MFAFAFFFSPTTNHFLASDLSVLSYGRVQRGNLFPTQREGPLRPKTGALLCEYSPEKKIHQLFFTMQPVAGFCTKEKAPFRCSPHSFPRAFGFVYWLYTQRRKRPTAGGCLGARGRQHTNTLSSLLSDQRQRLKNIPTAH